MSTILTAEKDGQSITEVYFNGGMKNIARHVHRFDPVKGWIELYETWDDGTIKYYSDGKPVVQTYRGTVTYKTK